MSVEITIRPFADDDAPQVRELFIVVNRLLSPPDLREAFEAYIERALAEEIDRITAYYGERGGQAKLAPKQRRLITEIEDIAASIQMDYWSILDYDEDGRTYVLEGMKQQLVRSEIIMKYTLLDELLSVIICHFYFKQPREPFTFTRLWRTKKFQLFAHYFLDETYLLNKMRLVHAIKEMPSDIRNSIEHINALRNAIAHSFFPENRRQYKSYKKVMYRDANIFSKEGVTRFLEDAERAQDYLMHQAFGVNPADARAEIEAE